MYEIFAKLMAERGLTAYRVSMDTGVSQATLSDWKRGRSTPKLPKLQKLADYFGVSLEYLMGADPNGRPEPMATSMTKSWRKSRPSPNLHRKE